MATAGAFGPDLPRAVEEPIIQRLDMGLVGLSIAGPKSRDVLAQLSTRALFPMHVVHPYPTTLNPSFSREPSTPALVK